MEIPGRAQTGDFVEPERGIEPLTCSLRVSRSTPELLRPGRDVNPLPKGRMKRWRRFEAVSQVMLPLGKCRNACWDARDRERFVGGWGIPFGGGGPKGASLRVA